MRHVTEVENGRAEDWNVVDVMLEMTVGTDTSLSPEIFEFYLEHTPILYV